MAVNAFLEDVVREDRRVQHAAAVGEATAEMINHVADALEHRLSVTESEQLAALRRRGAPKLTALCLVTRD
jgi:hypothetical protein